MKHLEYTKRTLLILLLTLFIGTMCQAQSNTKLPFEEMGISKQEFKDMQNKDTLNIQESVGFNVEEKTLHPLKTYPDKGLPLKFNPIPFIPMEECIIKEEEYENN